MSRVLEVQPRAHVRAEMNGLPNPVKERREAATNLRNQFVLSSPVPELVPQAARIDREFQLISTMTKNKPSVSEKVSDLIGTSLAAYAGAEKIQFVHEIGSVKGVITALREELAIKSTQKMRSVDALLTSIDFLEARGRVDADAVDSARELLLSFAGTLMQYNPELAKTDRDELVSGRQQKVTSNSKQLQPRTNEISRFLAKPDVVLDLAGVHQRDPEVDPSNLHNGKPVTIHRIRVPAIPLAHERDFERDGATAIVRVPTEGEPLEYAVSLLVKEEGKWRKVHLAQPVAPNDMTPGNIESQQLYPWTVDLPKDKAKYAIVVEATPWTLDVINKEKGGTVHTMFASKEDEKKASRAFLEAMIDAKEYFSWAFDTFGLTGSDINIKGQGAQLIREFLVKEGREDILNMEILSSFTGSQDITRLALSIASRVGFAGNDKPTPLSVLIESNNHGGELFETNNKPDDPKEHRRNIEATAEEKTDRSEICEALGIRDDQARQEIFIFDQIATFTQVGDRSESGGASGNASTRDIYTQPLARHESQGKGEASTLVEIVPLVGQRDQERVITRPSSINTVGDMLQFIAEVPIADFYQPKVRLDAPIIISAMEAQQAAIDKWRRDAERSAGPRNFGLLGNGGFEPKSLAGGDYAPFTGFTTLLGRREERGESDIGSRNIIGQLPPITIALAGELEAAPVRAKRQSRQKHLR